LPNKHYSPWTVRPRTTRKSEEHVEKRFGDRNMDSRYSWRKIKMEGGGGRRKRNDVVGKEARRNDRYSVAPPIGAATQR